jgi:hypothetical protein
MRVVKCPQCGTEVEWSTNPYRPFCSERCRLVDLGAWLDEKYVIPGSLRDESGDEAASGSAAEGANGHDDDS